MRPRTRRATVKQPLRRIGRLSPILGVVLGLVFLAACCLAGCSKLGGAGGTGGNGGSGGNGGGGSGGGASSDDMAGGNGGGGNGGGGGGSSTGDMGGGGSGGGGGGGVPGTCLANHTDNQAASINPPAGLAANRVPQFV